MSARFKIVRRAADWCITGLGGRVVYCDPCYPKVTGVFDFLTEWGGFSSVSKAEAAEAASNATPTHGRAD